MIHIKGVLCFHPDEACFFAGPIGCSVELLSLKLSEGAKLNRCSEGYPVERTHAFRLFLYNAPGRDTGQSRRERVNMIEKSVLGGAILVRVTAEQIDLTNVDNFLAAIGSAISPSRGSQCIVDLHAVQVLAAQGVNVLVAVHKQLQHAGGQLRLRGVQESVYTKLQTLNLTNVLTIEDGSSRWPNEISHDGYTGTNRHQRIHANRSRETSSLPFLAKQRTIVRHFEALPPSK